MYGLDNPIARRRIRLGSPRLASLAFLGASTSTPAQQPSSESAAAAMASLNIPANDAYYNWTLDAIEQGELPDYEPGVLTGTAVQFTGGTAGCSSDISNAKATLAQAIGGTGVSVTSALTTAGVITLPALPVSLALIGASALITGISTLFSHHTKAVAQERGTLCGYVPSANATLEQLADYYAAGQITAATYVQALQQVLTQFQQGTASVSSSTDWTGGTCNEGCIYNRALKGIVLKLTADLQGAPAATGPAASGAAAGGAGARTASSSGGGASLPLGPIVALVAAYLLLS